MLFELFYVSFGQAIASFSPSDLLASILVPVFFLFVVSFCGGMLPQDLGWTRRQLTYLKSRRTVSCASAFLAILVSFFNISFRRSVANLCRMYYFTPFRYLLDGFLGVAVHGIKVKCADNEFARFAAPPGQTCQTYTQPYIAQAGGYVQNGANGLCELCQYATGDEFVSTFWLLTLWFTGNDIDSTVTSRLLGSTFFIRING